MENLTELTELQIANNEIASIGHALAQNTKIHVILLFFSSKTLNLSGNKISSFREILYLTGLPCLRNLLLSDPNYDSNPICQLCNYQTHVVYHLPSISYLDTLQVTLESRKMIQATVLKKRMQVFIHSNV